MSHSSRQDKDPQLMDRSRTRLQKQRRKYEGQLSVATSCLEPPRELSHSRYRSSYEVERAQSWC